MTKTHIVIVGGGFAAVAAAKKLALYVRLHPLVSVTLISRSKVALFTPLLHEVATGSLRPEGVGESLAEIFKGTTLRIVYDRVQNVELGAREVVLEKGSKIPFDYLVLATGAKPNFFNIPGAEQFSYTLKTLEDAVELKKAIVHTASRTPKEGVRDADSPYFVIVGGGPTGVETAAELAFYLRKTFQIQKPKITVVQRAPDLIPMFPEKFRTLAKERLEKLGVVVLLGKGVKEVCE